MTVIDIVLKYLKDNGYDGLLDRHGECGCEIDDLAPCGEMQETCEAGYQAICSDKCDHGTGCDWHIQRDKP